jgi:hypothetical protein
MSLNQPLLLSSALVHQVLLSPTTYPYKQVTLGSTVDFRTNHSLRQVRCLGRGPYGRGRGHNKDTITGTMRASKRQKEPSIALIFYKLLLSCALLRQKSTFHVDE